MREYHFKKGNSFGKANKGLSKTPETKQKISMSRKGKNLGNTNGFKKSVPSWNKGLNSGNHGNGFKKGQAIRKGTKHTLESRLKMSKSLKGRISTFKGKKQSPASRAKISLALKGKEHTRERNELNRQSQYNRYLKLNPDYKPLIRNSRIAKNGGFHTNGQWENLKAQYNWTCPCCKKTEQEVKLTRDHIIPLLKGGSNNIENIQPLCKLCNCKKHINTIKY